MIAEHAAVGFGTITLIIGISRIIGPAGADAAADVVRCVSLVLAEPAAFAILPALFLRKPV